MIGIVILAASLATCNPSTGGDPHVRSSEETVRRFLVEGCRGSATFRGLLADLETSDLVVYVRTAPSQAGEPAGRVAFIAATAARRYVLVTLNSRLPGPTLIGLLGHELQHAVEIAGAAEVVNDSVMARLYERIGTAGARREGKRCFDSGAAVVVGHRVYKELQMSGLAHDF